MKKLSAIELNNQVMKRNESGFFDLEKDQEALKVYLEEVDSKMIKFESYLDRLHYLVDHNFYYNLFKEYSKNEIEELYEFTMSIPFQFASYMSASKFFKDYALKTNDKKQYLENYHEHSFIVALYLASGDKEKAKELISALIEQRYQPATPTWLNSGRARRGELVSCFLLSTDDSLNSINYVDATAKQLLK